MHIVNALLESISRLDLRDDSNPDHRIYRDIVMLVYREAVNFWRNEEGVEAAIARNNLTWILDEQD